MAAAWIKGKRRIIGLNNTRIPGPLKHPSYAWYTGRHSELHIWLQAQAMGQSLRGGTLYVAGTRTGMRSKNRMSTTMPCEFCSELYADTASVNFVVYYLEGQPVRQSFDDFITARRDRDYHQSRIHTYECNKVA